MINLYEIKPVNIRRTWTVSPESSSVDGRDVCL